MNAPDEARTTPSICMLVRTSVWQNPRVVKQARSLARAGWKVTVVSARLPDENALSEHHPAGFDILRTRPGGIRSWLGLRRYGNRPAASSNDGRSESVPRKPAPMKPYNPRGLAIGKLLFHRFVILVKMLPLIRRVRPDVVLAHNVNTLTTGWLGARLTGASLAYDAHEVNLDREGYYQQLKPVIRVVEGCLIPRCNLAMSTTGMRARHFRRVYGLATTPRVFENRPPRVDSNARADLRASLGLSNDAVVALYQGGLQEGRGLHNMVRATARVADLQLVFLGDGRQKSSLQMLAEELGIDERVHFPGQLSLDELPAWTASADFGLQLLRNTSFNHFSTDSNKLFEYAVSGIPVIASDFPEIRKIVRAHGYGLLVDPHDVEAIANAMAQLKNDTDLREELTEAARAAAPKLCWEAVEDDYIAAMEELVTK